MAGDWIKIECVTPDKPEVHLMAESLCIDPDAVVGKLIRVWIWADQQTLDGNATGVTRSLLDRVTGVTGFADALISCGWLAKIDGGFVFTNFGNHNGETAKKRALTAKRVSKHRNAASVTSALPREEKRREEIKDLKDSAAKKQAAKRSKISESFLPSEAHREFAGQQGVSVIDELPKFIDYHRAKGSLMASWDAAFRTWLRNAAKFNQERGSSNAGHQANRGAGSLSLVERVAVANGLNRDGTPRRE